MIKVSTTGMAVSLKTDLRFPESGQHGHGSRIIHPVIKLEKTQSGKMQRLKMEKQFIQGAYDSLLEKYGVIKEQSNTSGSDVKMTILNIWKEILNNNSISEEDNFFDLGGSSSLLILLTTKIEERFPDCISAIDIFEAPTVKELSKLVIDRIKE